MVNQFPTSQDFYYGKEDLKTVDALSNGRNPDTGATIDTWVTRGGDTVRTIPKIISDADAEFDATIIGMGFGVVGKFSTGATLTNPRQTLLWGIADGGDGHEYGWSGAFPKAVPPLSTPNTTGGVSVGAWLSRFDPVLRNQVRENYRRSYAVAGFNLVAGSFEIGGVLVSSTDVLLQESTGRAYRGPAGTVVAGTDPTSGGGFVDVSKDITLQFDTVEDMRGFGGFSLGQKVEWSGYYSAHDGGGNSGIVVSGPFVDDGGSLFVTTSGFTIEADFRGNRINAKCFGLKGDYTTNDKPQFVKLLDYAPWGSEIYYPEGCYKIDGGHTHPLKQLKHIGAFAAPTFLPSASNIRGTSFYFPTYTPTANKGGLYMPPPDGSNFCRFSLLQDITLFGNGVDDDTGNVTCLKINNLGTHLVRVYSRYGAVGIENNYSVGAYWDVVHAIGSTYGVHHVYDPDTPFGTEKNAIATENVYTNILVATSKTNTSAIGWYQDATSQYANNHHGGQFDCEQCYTGAKFEGRISAKDHDGVSVYGSAAFQGVGNVIDSAWFEANTGQNLVLSFDPGSAAPALTFRNLYQDVDKVTTAADVKLVLTTPEGDRALKLGATKDAAQGRTGTWQSPFTANQFLLHGKEGNFPLMRTIVEERICKKLGNRSSINEKGGYSFSYAKDNVPLVASAVNIANLRFFSASEKSVLIDYDIVATGSSGAHYFVTGKIAVNIDSGSVTFQNLPNTESFLPAGTKPVILQPIAVSGDTFGLYIYKDASVAQDVYATVNVKYTVGGNGDGDRQSELTTFSV